jgi:hypothetical protein
MAIFIDRNSMNQCDDIKAKGKAKANELTGGMFYIKFDLTSESI